jgi:hypothetical protein
MGSSTADIVARLQLNASQFSSSTGAAFAELKSRAASTAQEVRSSFNSSFAEVQRLAQNALTLPRTSGGALDLSSEISQLKASAAAADQRAIALRELSIAQTTAAASAGHNAEALHLDADASAIGALAEERAAQATRDRITSLESVQAALGSSTSLTKLDAAAMDNVAARTGRASIAKMELMHVVRSSSDAFAAGASPIQIFGTEIGRLAEAAELSGGSLGKFGKFIGSGWGIAITTGLAILSPLVMKMFEADDAAKKATESFDAWGDAQTLLGKVMDLTTGKMKTQNEVLLESVRLSALLNKEKATDDLRSAKSDLAQTPTSVGLRALGQRSGAGAGAITAALQGKEYLDSPELKGLFDQIQAGGIGIEDARKKLEDMTKSGAVAGQTFDQLFPKILKVFDAQQRGQAAQADIDAIDGKGLDPRLVPYKKPKKTPDQSRESESAAEEIARINAEWDLQPKLIDKANVETLKLNNLITDLQRRKPPGFEKLISDARGAQQAIQDGLNRPFTDFIQKQRESVAVEQLALQGRTAEAAALQDALRLQDQQGQVSDKQLAGLLQIERTQERIRDALEDQRRVIGLYGQAVANVQHEFDTFLNALETRPTGALKGLVSGVVADFRSLQNGIISEQLFGGMQREIERWVAQRAGGSTPADLLKTQVLEVGKTWTAHVGDTTTALDTLKAAFLSAANTFGKPGLAAANDSVDGLAASISKAVNDNRVALPSIALPGVPDEADEVLITGKRIVDSLGQTTTKLTTTTDLFDHIGSSLIDNLERLLGVKLPATLDKTLKSNLGGVLQGAAFGQLGGGVFQSLGGGKDDKLASGIGGILGKKAGDALSAPISAAIGGTLGKTLGGLAGPLGGIVGGIAGDFVSKLLSGHITGKSTISVNNYGDASASAGFGTSASANAAAVGEANSIIQGVQQVASALGATIQSFGGVTVGTRDGDYRVNTTGTSLKTGKGAKNFDDDQAAAIQYAIAQSIQKGVITGISQASINIIKSGQDLTTAIGKAELIEAVPKSLKAMLDPVGAALDDLNSKWKQTVSALQEGGASAEQMAQAQDLYNRQLAQVKASTDAADASLVSFKKSLILGSDSPYSLRDQETTAKAALQPYLDAINVGSTIDQQKYQDAAQAFLDVERQLYGSTSQYFDALGQIQTATSKAIDAIDNVTPIGSPVADPFATATASATQQTATNTATGNQLLSQLSDQMQQLNTTLAGIAANDPTSSDFIGALRGFAG